MCNINILLRKQGQKQDLSKALSLIEQTTGASFLSNSDGEGVYFSGTQKVLKSTTKIRYGNYQRDFKRSRVVMTHQRLSTSGFSKKYIHPFHNEEFAMVHNGVVSSYAKGKRSDTHNLFQKFLSEYAKRRNMEEQVSHEARIIKTIKTVFNGLEGSWSIALYDKATHQLYYWKNSSPSINFYSTKEWLFISTADRDKLLPADTKMIDVKDYTIYRVQSNGKVYNIGSIEKPTTSQYYYSDKHYNDYQKYWRQREREGKEKTKKEDKKTSVTVVKNSKERDCEYCTVSIGKGDNKYYHQGLQMIMCKSCYDMHREYNDTTKYYQAQCYFCLEQDQCRYNNDFGYVCDQCHVNELESTSLSTDFEEVNKTALQRLFNSR